MQLKGITDGLSNTIAYAEHYAYRCNATQFDWASANTRPWKLDPPAPDGVKLLRAATFADRLMGDAMSGDRRTFQVRPKLMECDPGIAQTPHDGMPVAMCDGSVRVLNAGMSAATFWAAVTPNGGETLGADW